MEISLFTLAAIIAVCMLLFKWSTRGHDYYLDKPIPSTKPIPIFGDSFRMLILNKTITSHVTSLYNMFPDAKIMGMFNMMKPTYVIRDPDYVKKLAVKDFDYFIDHSPILVDENFDPGASLFGNSLFALRGQKWRDMRAGLSPAFTGSKMRQMFELVLECSENMSKFILEGSKGSSTQIHEMKEIFSRFTNDVIGTAAFGLKIDSFRDRENMFYLMGKKLITSTDPLSIFKFIMFQICPTLMMKLGFDFVNPEMTKFFKDSISNTMDFREKEGITRPDMIHLLLQMKKGKLTNQIEDAGTSEIEGFATVEESDVGKSVVTKMWSDDELFAQCFLFFLAGFDTTSTCLSFVAYELMANPDVQQKLYAEVSETNELLNGKPLTYVLLQKINYLDMVVSETLRKWPPVPVVDRYCVKDYVFDDGHGIKFKIEKGKVIWIPIQGFHYDPKYYPNPDKFDPERFSEENKGNINLGTYLPFGVGPRNCIGSRFALMEVKAIIYNLLLKFSFEATEKSQIPVKLVKSFVGLQSEKGIWMEFKPRN